MSLYSSSIRTLLRRWDELELIEGLLYIKIRDQVTNTYSPRLVAPEGVRNQILTMLHNDRPAGHLGREKTLAKVKQHVYWPGMAEDVATWVRQCDRCAQRKPGPGRAKHPMGHKNVGIPFERIAIDILGGLPRSHDGFLYIMVVEDYFSKWVEAYCLTEHTAQAVADKLLTQWICRFGVPSSIHSDQGGEFDSNLFHHLSQELGSLKTMTMPYHPQGDGMVERQNRTIIQMLSCYANDCHDDWSDHLDYVMMAYRSAMHESTGCSPNRVIFGKENNLPLTVQLGEQHYCHGAECPIEYVQWVKNTLERVYSFVREKSQKSTARQKKNYDRKNKIVEIKEGMLVWRWYPPKGRPKLGLGWTGPYKVEELLGNHVVKLKNRNREIIVHRDDIKPYLGMDTFADSESESESESKESDAPESEYESGRESPEESFHEVEAEDDFPEEPPLPPVKTTRRGREVRLPSRFLD